MTPLTEIESYFKDNPPTKSGVVVNHGVTVISPDVFVEAKIAILKANSGNRAYNDDFLSLHRYYTFCRFGKIEPPIEPLNYKRIREELKS